LLKLGNRRSGERLVNWIDKRFYKNQLNEKLKRQSARRTIAIVGFFLPLFFGYMLGFAAWSFLAPNPVTTLERFLSLIFWFSMFPLFLIPSLVQRALQSVLHVPGQPFDERQQQLNIKARSQAYPFAVFLMVVGMLTGFAMIVATVAGYLPWGHPYYGGLHFYVGLFGTLLILSNLSPILLLAWQLPDEIMDEEV